MVWSFLYTFRGDRTVEDELIILDVWLDDNYWILVFQKINIGQLCFSMVHQHLRILRSDLIVQKWLLAFIGSKCTRPNYYLHLLFFGECGHGTTSYVPFVWVPSLERLPNQAVTAPCFNSELHLLAYHWSTSPRLVVQQWKLLAAWQLAFQHFILPNATLQ